MFDVSNFSVREWIVIAIAVLFIAIILDGVRRSVARRRHEVKLSKKAKQGFNAGVAMDAKDAADAARVRFELPSTARVVPRENSSQDRQQALDIQAPTHSLEEVPVLSDTADGLSISPPTLDKTMVEREDTSSARAEASLAAVETVETSTPERSDETRDQVKHEPQAQHTASSPLQDDVKEVVSFYVESNHESGFSGPELLEVLLPLRLRFGEMNIFHKRSESSPRKPVMYSVANAKEPGTFNLQKLNEFSTTSLVFFMRLPGPEHPAKAFQEMLSDAQTLAGSLNGTLLDDQRNILHKQSVVHIDERIREFERKQLLEKRRAGQ